MAADSRRRRHRHSRVVAFPIKGKMRLGLDLSGGVHIVLQAKGTPESPLTPDSIDRLLVVLRSRIDQYGIVEPIIQREGDDRVAIGLPGVDDPEAALDLIGRTAVLQFRQVLGESPRIPLEPIRSNYDNDEQFKAAQERWQRAKDEVGLYIEQMKEAVKDNPEMAVANSEEGGAYLLGKQYVSGGDLTKAERPSTSSAKRRYRSPSTQKARSSLTKPRLPTSTSR
mgnify:CR=1 FL=1